MNIIWSLENIEGDKNFYSKLNILLLLSSVRLWIKHNPTDVCILYCDDMTYEVLKSLRVLNFWDEIKEYKNSRKIDKTVFWASSKLEVLSQQTEPCILMDNDTLCYVPLKPYLDLSKHYVCNMEHGKGYYPTSYDQFIRKLSYKTRWKTNSVNVSFLNLPDPQFTNLYSNLSLDMMEEMTDMNVPNPQYLIFAEQLLLCHLFEKHQIDYKCILSTYWDCEKWDWGEEHDNGIWSYQESGQYFKHYGPLKTTIQNSEQIFSLEEECKDLIRGINYPELNLEVISKMK